MILLDLQMPVMSGREFLQHFRKRPEWVHVPIIITSGTVEPAEISETPPVVEALRKPVDVPHLLALVARCTTPCEASHAPIESDAAKPDPALTLE